MKIKYAKNPQWADSAKTHISLTVKFLELAEELPFTASATDIEPHGRELFERASAGEFGAVTESPSAEITLKALTKPYTDAAQKRMDEFTHTREYDSLLHATSYTASSNPKFRAEGQYCVDLRDATWVISYEIFAEQLLKYPNGLPTLEVLLHDFPVETYLSMVPRPEWPNAA